MTNKDVWYVTRNSIQNSVLYASIEILQRAQYAIRTELITGEH